MNKALKYLLIAVCIYSVLAIFVLERDFFPTGVSAVDIAKGQTFYIGNFKCTVPEGFTISSSLFSVDSATIEAIPNPENKPLEIFWGDIAESKSTLARHSRRKYAGVDLSDAAQTSAYAMCYADGTGGYTINSFFAFEKMVLNISEARVYPGGDENKCTDIEDTVLKIFAHYQQGAAPIDRPDIYYLKGGYLMDYPAQKTQTVVSIEKKVEDPTRHFVITVETSNELWEPPDTNILALNALAVPWGGFFSSVRNGERQFAGLPGKEFLVIASEKSRKTLVGEWTALKKSSGGLAVQASLDAPDTHKAEALKAWDVFLGSIELLQ